MDEGLDKCDRFDWRLPLFAAVGTLIAYLPITALTNDIGWLLYSFAVSPLVAIVMVGIAIANKGGRRLAVLSMLATYGVVSGAILSNYSDARSEGRWLIHSRQYKAEVLAQPLPPNGRLRHINWDGWGMAGQDTEIYLTYDPSDSLSHEDPARGKFGSLRCDVWRVQRLENHWYAVTFFTDEGWESNCDPLAPGPR
jgi:hypothetical protein